MTLLELELVIHALPEPSIAMLKGVFRPPPVKLRAMVKSLGAEARFG